MVTPIRSTTQTHLDIETVLSDLVLLKNGSAAMVLLISSINFSLLSEEEQDATIYAYAALLNSLSFPIQILIRSQKKDVSNYLELLSSQEQKQTNPLLKQRIADYRRFITTTVKEGNILDKKFYVIIPFSYLEFGLTPVKSSPYSKPQFTNQLVQKATTVLKPKRDHLLRQFNRLGLKTRQLNTQELVKLLHDIYNPHANQSQEFAPADSYSASLVHAATV